MQNGSADERDSPGIVSEVGSLLAEASMLANMHPHIEGVDSQARCYDRRFCSTSESVKRHMAPNMKRPQDQSALGPGRQSIGPQPDLVGKSPSCRSHDSPKKLRTRPAPKRPATQGEGGMCWRPPPTEASPPTAGGLIFAMPKQSECAKLIMQSTLGEPLGAPRHNTQCGAQRRRHNEASERVVTSTPDCVVFAGSAAPCLATPAARTDRNNPSNLGAAKKHGFDMHSFLFSSTTHKHMPWWWEARRRRRWALRRGRDNAGQRVVATTRRSRSRKRRACSPPGRKARWRRARATTHMAQRHNNESGPARRDSSSCHGERPLPNNRLLGTCRI